MTSIIITEELFSKHNIKIPADNILLNRRDSSNRTDREMTIPMIKESRKL